MVRAKFRLNSFTVDLHTTYPHKKENGSTDHSRPEHVEKRTLNMTPVCSDDPKDENRAFWDATPSGSLQLGVVNQGSVEALRDRQDVLRRLHAGELMRVRVSFGQQRSVGR